MAERDGSAIDVDDIGIEAGGADDGEGLGGGVDLIVGNVSATLAPNTGINGCRIWFEFADDGEFGPEFHPSLELANGSSSENATRTESIEPFTLPLDPSRPAQLTARIRNNVGSCGGPSTIESMDLRVIELG